MNSNFASRFFIIVIFTVLPIVASDTKNNEDDVVFMGNKPLYLTMPYKKRLRDTKDTLSKKSDHSPNKRLQISHQNTNHEQPLVMELKKFNWTSDGLTVENFVDDCVDTFWNNFALHNDPEIKVISISEMEKRMQKYISQYKGRNFIAFAEFHFNGSCSCRNINLYNTLIAPETVDSRKSTFRVFKNLAEENNHFIQSKSLTEMDELIPLYYPDEEDEKIMFKEEKK